MTAQIRGFSKSSEVILIIIAIITMVVCLKRKRPIICSNAIILENLPFKNKFITKIPINTIDRIEIDKKGRRIYIYSNHLDRCIVVGELWTDDINKMISVFNKLKVQLYIM